MSKIPLVGFLFGNTDRNVTKKELVILLTPHVVKSKDNAAQVTSEFIDRFTEKGSQKEIKKEDLIKTMNPAETIKAVKP